MSINDPKHPVWPLCSLIVICTVICFLSYTQATKFDSNEVITIIGVLAAVASIETARFFLTKRIE